MPEKIMGRSTHFLLCFPGTFDFSLPILVTRLQVPESARPPPCGATMALEARDLSPHEVPRSVCVKLLFVLHFCSALEKNLPNHMKAIPLRSDSRNGNYSVWPLPCT